MGACCGKKKTAEEHRAEGIIEKQRYQEEIHCRYIYIYI